MAAESPALEPRELELADRLVEVAAPAGWPDARVEAWYAGEADLFANLSSELAERAAKGQVAVGLTRPQPATIVDVEAVEFEAALAAHLGAGRSREAANAATEATAARLTKVMEAISRCEGDPAA